MHYHLGVVLMQIEQRDAANDGDVPPSRACVSRRDQIEPIVFRFVLPALQSLYAQVAKLAEENLVACLRVDPNHVGAEYTLGRLYMKSGRKAEGQALIDKFESQQEAEKVKEQSRPRISSSATIGFRPKGEMMNVATRLKSPAIFLISIIAYFSFLACPARAQFNSGFTGVVVEQSDAAVGGAKVVVINQDTQVSRYAITSDSGDFRITSLPGGIYTIQVDAQGFKQWEQKGVVLESNEVKTLHPILGLSTQTTTVEVSGAVSAVETDKSNTSVELSETSIKDAPLLGRNVYTSMIELAPGVTGSGLPSGGALGSGSANNDSFEQEAGYQINAAGQRQENNEYDVDGSGINSASRDGVVNLSPEPDFIQAIRISGATFDAAKGRYSGAYVQVFTKPGTNEWHGSLSEYHTDNALTARTIFQNCPSGESGCRAIPAFRRNEFGGTVGGPILKDKLFVFGGAFGLRSSNATTDVATVETPQFVQFVQTNFPNNLCKRVLQASASGRSIRRATSRRSRKWKRRIPASSRPRRFHPISLSLVPRWCRRASRTTLISGTSAWTTTSTRRKTASSSTCSARIRTSFRRIHGLSIASWFRTPASIAKLDYTHTFSPTLLNDAGFTVVRAVGSNPGTANNRDLPDINVSGAAGFNQWGPAGWVHENFNWHDVLTWTHGRHTFSGGIDFDRHHDDDNFTAAVLRPTFGFANLIDFAQDQPFSQSGPTVNVAEPSTQANLYQVLRWIYLGAFCPG